MNAAYLMFLFVLLAFLNASAVAPLPRYTPALCQGKQARDALIMAYFKQAFTYKEILMCLAAAHNIIISMKTLKRILRRLGFKRRTPCTDEVFTSAIVHIQKELKESGQMLGYKAMWKRLQEKGFVIARDTVRAILLQLDGEGVRERGRRRLRRRQYINPGPNFVWHVDGYDKLKPYGFAIHGAIDGYSRRVLWIEVGVTNNNPQVIAKYYLETVLQLKTLPCILRCDHGTENVHLRDVQEYLRRNGRDYFAGVNSFIRGKSSSNQRIEAWWGILRKQCVNYWMNLFKDMISFGLLDTSDSVHIHALRFSFLDLIQDDVDRMAMEWNRHLIETKKNAEAPRGKPDIMYFNPQLYMTESCGVECPKPEVETILNGLLLTGVIPENHDPDFTTLINLALPNWELPSNVDSALSLYAEILDRLAQVKV